MGVQEEEMVTNGHTSHGFYRPPAKLDTQEKQLQTLIENKYGVKFASYGELHRWSCDNYAEFWETLLLWSGVELSTPYTEVIDKSLSIAQFPRWFEGAHLNYTQAVLKRGNDDDVAFINADLNLDLERFTYKQLRSDVKAIATSLRAVGVGKGDHVCGFLPNTYHTCVAMFASAAVGATWCSASVDFGPSGVLDRFRQVNPKVLFSVEAVTYKGKRFDLRDKLNTVVDGLPSLEKVVLIQNLKDKIDISSYQHASKYELLHDFQTDSDKVPENFQYEQVPWSHPLFVMFSSGTTGIPKAIVHCVGGTLLKHIEEHLIQGDVRSTDKILFYTTCGWMMWNWLMTFTFSGGCTVLYDESPFEPDQHILMKIAAKSGATIIGMGAKLYDEYTKMDADFKTLYDLSSVRLILSTGSPLKPASFEYINKQLAPGAVIGSISGGTDIIGCFMGGTLSLPVYAGECQCLFLGMDIKAFSQSGEAIEDEQGELVCLAPFPSMPIFFLGDKDYAKYRRAYFEGFPGVWAHGDFCQINSKTGGVMMLGRSDATLNRGGVRIGTAEIYSVVETFSQIEDCIVAGQNVPAVEDEHIILFVKMSPDSCMSDELKKKICMQIRSQMSPRHVPNAIHTVKDIPYTNSGKKVELAVKQIINGEKVVKASSIRNPEALDLYTAFRLAA